MIFDCQELFLNQGIVQKKSYETTVEFLGDLLALLFCQPGEDEGDEDLGDRRDEREEGKEREEDVTESTPSARASPLFMKDENPSEGTNGVDSGIGVDCGVDVGNCIDVDPLHEEIKLTLSSGRRR